MSQCLRQQAVQWVSNVLFLLSCLLLLNSLRLSARFSSRAVRKPSLLPASVAANPCRYNDQYINCPSLKNQLGCKHDTTSKCLASCNCIKNEIIWRSSPLDLPRGSASINLFSIKAWYRVCVPQSLRVTQDYKGSIDDPPFTTVLCRGKGRRGPERTSGVDYWHVLGVVQQTGERRGQIKQQERCRVYKSFKIGRAFSNSTRRLSVWPRTTHLWHHGWKPKIQINDYLPRVEILIIQTNAGVKKRNAVDLFWRIYFCWK